MNNSGYVAEEREQDVDPELCADTDLHKDAKRRKENAEDDANDVHAVRSLQDLYQPPKRRFEKRARPAYARPRCVL